MAGLVGIAWLSEMNWRHGDAVRGWAGTGLLALGLAVVLHPQFLTTLAPNLA